MFRLFAALWRRRAAVDSAESFSIFRRLTPPPQSEESVDLPADYVVAKFYFSKAFPDTQANRTFVTEMLRCVTRQAPVALLSTSVRLDEHNDFRTQANSGLFVVDSHSVPQRNLELQTESSPVRGGSLEPTAASRIWLLSTECRRFRSSPAGMVSRPIILTWRTVYSIAYFQVGSSRSTVAPRTWWSRPLENGVGSHLMRTLHVSRIRTQCPHQMTPENPITKR